MLRASVTIESRHTYYYGLSLGGTDQSPISTVAPETEIANRINAKIDLIVNSGDVGYR